MKERRLTRYPFEGYYTNEPSFHSRIKRYQLFLYPIDKTSGLKNTSISYGRYLYCVHNKAKLSKSITVDHIDGDRTHDILSNLQMLTIKDNIHKRSIQNNVCPNKITLKCLACDILFIKDKRQTFLSKGGKFTTCSRKCAGTFRQQLQQAVKRGIGLDKLNLKISMNVVAYHENNVNGTQLIKESHIIEDWKLFTDEYKLTAYK